MYSYRNFNNFKTNTENYYKRIENQSQIIIFTLKLHIFHCIRYSNKLIDLKAEEVSQCYQVSLAPRKLPVWDYVIGIISRKTKLNYFQLVSICIINKKYQSKYNIFLEKIDAN